MVIIYSAEETESFEIYKKVDRKCQMWTKLTLISNVGAVAMLFMVPFFVHSLFCMWQGNFDTSTWFWILKLATPFDTSNIFVWYGLVIVGDFMAMVNTFLGTTIIMYFMSCSFYVDASLQHFHFVSNKIEEIINKNSINVSFYEIKRKLCSAVFLHVKIIGSVILLVILRKYSDFDKSTIIFFYFSFTEW